MPKIKNMGSATMRFGEGIIVSGLAGSDVHTLSVTGSLHVSSGITGSITRASSDLDGNRLLGGLYQLDDGLIQNPNSSYSRIYFPADSQVN